MDDKGRRTCRLPIRMFRQTGYTLQTSILMWLVHGAIMFADDAAMIALIFC